MFWKNKYKKNHLKYFISIGAGYNQLPLIIEAKKLGYTLIGVDQNTSAIGFTEADIKIQESITNYEEIFTKVQELLLDGQIVGILSRSYGPAIKTTAYLSEKFKIPYIPFLQTDNLLDKKKMKKILKKNNILTPKFYLYNSKKTKTYNYPVIIKPSEGHAKKGVELIQDETKLKSYLKTSKKNSNLIIEEYIDGDEIITLGLIIDKKFHLVEITDKKLTNLPYFVDLTHISPSKYLHKWNEIISIGQKITDAFEIHTSPLLIEFRIDKKDKLYVLETAAEFGGEFLSDILIPKRSGYNIIKQALSAISGDNFSLPSYKKNNPSVIVQYITGKSGKLKSFTPFDIQKNNNIIFTRIFKDIGSKIKKPISNHDRVGVVVTKGKNIQIAEAEANKAIENLNLIIK